MKRQPTVTLQRMLACAERELAMRRRVYPNWVRSEKMTQTEADDEISALEAIVNHFKDLTEPGLF